MGDFLDRLKSRKFLLAVFGVIFLFVTDILQIPLDAATVNGLIQLFLGYILAEGAADVTERYVAGKKD